MSLPASKTEPGAGAAWLAEVRRLADRLGELTGRKISSKSLREACELTNARQAAFRDLLTLRTSSPPRLSGKELLTVVAASFTDDIQRFTSRLRDLTAERRAAPPPSGALLGRVLLTGAPLIPPNTRLVDVIEGAGLAVVADDLCNGTERLYHPVVPMEWSLGEMLRALAEKTLLPCTCPCFTDHADRVNRLLGLVEEYGVEGVIYHNLRTCMLFQFETAAIRDALRAESIPMLEVSTDYAAQDIEQLRTRVGAFAEMLKR